MKKHDRILRKLSNWRSNKNFNEQQVQTTKNPRITSIVWKQTVPKFLKFLDLKIRASILCQFGT